MRPRCFASTHFLAQQLHRFLGVDADTAHKTQFFCRAEKRVGESVEKPHGGIHKFVSALGLSFMVFHYASK